VEVTRGAEPSGRPGRAGSLPAGRPTLPFFGRVRRGRSRPFRFLSWARLGNLARAAL